MAFLNTGDFDDQPPSPYLEIGQELKIFAQTNYPGIPPANPIENTRPLLYPEQRRAWADMEVLIGHLERYATENSGAYPTTVEGLVILGSLAGVDASSIPLNDPWGNPYQYISPGVNQDYDLSSLGADGATGGEDLNADITSWAEASQIGLWHEYTPTSALDIVFNGPFSAGSGEMSDISDASADSLFENITSFLNSGSTSSKVIKWLAIVAIVIGAGYAALEGFDLQ